MKNQSGLQPKHGSNRPQFLQTIRYIKTTRWSLKDFIEFALTTTIRVWLRLVMGKEKRDKEQWVRRFYDSWANYEPEVSRALRQIRGNVFIDVGASRGQYTFPLSKRFGHVYSLEPLAENIKFLRHEVLRLRRPNVSLLQLAASNEYGRVRLNLNPNNIYGGASLLGASERHEFVDAQTLSGLFGGMDIDLVKVDVEGGEWLVLKGAESIMPQIKRWMIELHDPAREKELDSYLRRYGYRTCWLKNARSLPHIFATRDKITA